MLEVRFEVVITVAGFIVIVFSMPVDPLDML